MPGKALTKITSHDLRDYFEVMTRAVFQSGTSRGVVEARWGGLTAAFDGFDPVKVARFTPDAVDELMQDARMVRNRAKIEATVENAAEIVAVDREHGGFANYLRSHAGFDEVVEDLKHRFRLLGDKGAYFFLHMVGEHVPAREERIALQH